MEAWNKACSFYTAASGHAHRAKDAEAEESECTMSGLKRDSKRCSAATTPAPVLAVPAHSHLHRKGNTMDELTLQDLSLKPVNSYIEGLGLSLNHEICKPTTCCRTLHDNHIIRS